MQAQLHHGDMIDQPMTNQNTPLVNIDRLRCSYCKARVTEKQSTTKHRLLSVCVIVSVWTTVILTTLANIAAELNSWTRLKWTVFLANTPSLVPQLDDLAVDFLIPEDNHVEHFCIWFKNKNPIGPNLGAHWGSVFYVFHRLELWKTPNVLRWRFRTISSTRLKWIKVFSYMVWNCFSPNNAMVKSLPDPLP